MKSHHGKPTVQTAPEVVDVPDGLNQTRPGTCHLTAVLCLTNPPYGPMVGGTENPGVCAEYARCWFVYHRNALVYLVGVTYASFADDPDERRSQGGDIYLLGGAAVSWKSYRISIVARSTPEVENVAASDCAAEGIFLRNFLGELGLPQTRPTPVFTDSSGVQGMVISPAARWRMKHIEIQ